MTCFQKATAAEKRIVYLFVYIAGDFVSCYILMLQLMSFVGWPKPYVYGTTYIYRVPVNMVILAGKLPNIQSNTVHIKGFGQPYPGYLEVAHSRSAEGTIRYTAYLL